MDSLSRGGGYRAYSQAFNSSTYDPQPYPYPSHHLSSIARIPTTLHQPQPLPLIHAPPAPVAAPPPPPPQAPVHPGPNKPPERIRAYAKLEFPYYDFYILTLSLTIGRRPPGQVDRKGKGVDRGKARHGVPEGFNRQSDLPTLAPSPLSPRLHSQSPQRPSDQPHASSSTAAAAAGPSNLTKPPSRLSPTSIRKVAIPSTGLAPVDLALDLGLVLGVGDLVRSPHAISAVRRGAAEDGEVEEFSLDPVKPIPKTGDGGDGIRAKGGVEDGAVGQADGQEGVDQGKPELKREDTEGPDGDRQPSSTPIIRAQSTPELPIEIKNEPLQDHIPEESSVPSIKREEFGPIPASEPVADTDQPPKSSPVHVDVDLGPIKAVSRDHARLYWDHRAAYNASPDTHEDDSGVDEAGWVLEVRGRNGVVVEGRWRAKGEKVRMGKR